VLEKLPTKQCISGRTSGDYTVLSSPGLVSAYQLDRERLATKDDIAALKEDIAVVRTEIERMGRVVVMWNVGTLIAVASLVFALMRFTGDGGS
jgi:hypothetical protein